MVVLANFFISNISQYELLNHIQIYRIFLNDKENPIFYAFWWHTSYVNDGSQKTFLQVTQCVLQ